MIHPPESKIILILLHMIKDFALAQKTYFSPEEIALIDSHAQAQCADCIFLDFGQGFLWLFLCYSCS